MSTAVTVLTSARDVVGEKTAHSEDAALPTVSRNPDQVTCTVLGHVHCRSVCVASHHPQPEAGHAQPGAQRVARPVTRPSAVFSAASECHPLPRPARDQHAQPAPGPRWTPRDVRSEPAGTAPPARRTLSLKPCPARSNRPCCRLTGPLADVESLTLKPC